MYVQVMNDTPTPLVLEIAINELEKASALVNWNLLINRLVNNVMPKQVK